ncbi:BnaC04g50320D [Brassica napus]|uniref:BnaC04g50320D protein n=1 Tax=Brassica napus TaxID=3708 RepID=A0A078GRX6_BRANA|nr:BnaC04g50320D [Brassica napus]
MKTTGGPGVSSSEGHCCSSVLRNLHNDGSSVWNIISESWISRLKDPRGVQLHPSTSISLPLPFISANEKSTAVLFSHRQGGAVAPPPRRFVPPTPRCELTGDFDTALQRRDASFTPPFWAWALNNKGSSPFYDPKGLSSDLPPQSYPTSFSRFVSKSNIPMELEMTTVSTVSPNNMLSGTVEIHLVSRIIADLVCLMDCIFTSSFSMSSSVLVFTNDFQTRSLGSPLIGSCTDFSMFLGASVLGFQVKFVYGSRRKSFEAAATPPGPPRLPIIGNIHLVEAAREVLRTHDQVLSWRSSTNSIRSINHHEVSVAWLPPSARWRLLRKLSVTLLFSPQRIEATKALRLNKVKELVNFMNESSERDEPVDISRASFITALNIISNILFSVDLGSYDLKNSNEFQDAVIGVMEAIGNPDAANYFPFLGFLDMQGNRKAMKVASEKLFRVFREFIDAKIAKRSLRNDRENVSTHDFVDALLDLTKEDEVELNTNDFVHLLLDLFGAGTDTNSSTVEWAMSELLRSPKTMAKAQAEINRVLGQKGFVEESDISELPYLQAVVKEVFRLHPAAPLLVPRKAESDVEVLGFMVPKDTQVLVNVWAIGRDPSVWENPTRFEPERFLGKETDVRGRDYELTPFGAGRRICPGLPLAVKIVPLMLASLLYSFDWKLPNGVTSEDLDMDETFGLTLHKTNPLHAVPVRKHH